MWKGFCFYTLGFVFRNRKCGKVLPFIFLVFIFRTGNAKRLLCNQTSAARIEISKLLTRGCLPGDSPYWYPSRLREQGESPFAKRSGIPLSLRTLNPTKRYRRERRLYIKEITLNNIRCYQTTPNNSARKQSLFVFHCVRFIESYKRYRSYDLCKQKSRITAYKR